jgi:predicted ester cyclase
MTDHLVERVKTLYQTLNKDNVSLVRELYSDEVVFIDPFHYVKGIDAFERYISSMYENVIDIQFEYISTLLDHEQAMLIWSMQFRHKNLNGGMPIVVPGATHLRFKEKVTYHHDYFDGGALLYENLPLLGWAITKIKGRLNP